MSMATALRDQITSGGIIAAPGIYDMMSLLLANRHGFAAHYASGYWGTASALGLPDVGIASYRDFVTQFSRFAEASTAPLIADADTGFGSLANLAHAVTGYQQAGIAAMQIEDQPFPKVCGHSGRSRSAPADEMVTRIKVAVEARGDGDMIIIARSDARPSEGLAAALDRLRAYGEAGADVLFLEAPTGEDEIAQAAETLEKPLMINAAHGGKTPILNPSEYEALGAAIVIYPAGAPLAAAQATNGFYASLSGGNANSDGEGQFDFQEMCDLLGMNDVAALQERFGDA